MPTACLLPDFRPRLGDLLWSLWSELGIPGWERKHQGWWIDPEALLLFTATLDPIDPRLRDEAIAWCLSHRRLLSATRIRSMLQEPPYSDTSRCRPQLGRFLESIGRHIVPSDEAPQPYLLPARQPAVPRILARAALLSLRLRSLLGVTAKAEVIRALLARSRVPLTATDLVNEGVGYTKRAIRDALEDLRIGGFVDLQESGNRKGYLLRDRSHFADLLEPVPCHFPRWRPLLSVLRGLVDLSEGIGSFRPATRPIEIRRVLAALCPEIRAAGLRPPVLAAGSDVIGVFEDWAGELLAALASGQGAAGQGDLETILDPARDPTTTGG